MFILVLKQDGLLPVVKQTGEIVDVGLLGAIPCRAPTYEELSENLTIPQVKNMPKAVGIKNVGKTKEMVMRSIVRDWEMIEQRAKCWQSHLHEPQLLQRSEASFWWCFQNWDIEMFVKVKPWRAKSQRQWSLVKWRPLLSIMDLPPNRGQPSRRWHTSCLMPCKIWSMGWRTV